MIETAERHQEREHRRSRAVTAQLEATPEDDISPWKAIAGLVMSLAILIAALIALCFIVAKLVTGYAV